MDAGLGWTIVGSVAGAACAAFAGVQLWQSRRTTATAPSAPSPSGLGPESRIELPGSHGVQIGDHVVQVNQFFAPTSAPEVRRLAGLVVSGEIPQEPPGWQPRSELMAELDAPGPGSRVVVRAVTGMRGVGKTQLVAAYARNRLGQAGGRLVAWISAGTHSELLAGLTATAEALGLPADDAQAAGRAVRHWLEGDGIGCLLVLDNVTDPDLVQPFLPAGGAGRVFLTSNHQTIAELGTLVEVGVFTEAEGRAYLTERTCLADSAGAHELGSYRQDLWIKIF